MKRFDAYEIHATVQVDFGDGQNPVWRFKSDDLSNEGEHDVIADCWSLYGHTPGEGITSIGDFSTYQQARETYFAITGNDCGPGAPLDGMLVGLPVANQYAKLVVVGNYTSGTLGGDSEDVWFVAHDMPEAEVQYQRMIDEGAYTASICRVIKSTDYEGTGV